MPAGFLDKIDDNEAVFTPIGSLAGTEDMVLVADAKSGSYFAIRSAGLALQLHDVAIEMGASHARASHKRGKR